MKKVLSVILTMAMLLSMFSCLFTTGAAAETSNSVVIQDFESYTPAAEGTTSYPIDPDGSDSLDPTPRTNYNCVVKTDNTKYLNIWGFVNGSGKSVFYITNKTQTGLLDTNSTVYNLTFRYRLNKGTATATGTAVSIKVQNQVNNQNTLGEVAVTYSGSDVWKTATIKNIVPTDNGYVRMRIEGGNDGMSIDIDDIAFTEAVTASATANGVGTAKVNNTTPVYGTEMVYTAKTANTFLGWFDGDNKVSDDKVYTFTYNGTQPVALTAKFEGKTVVQDFETGFTQASGATSVLRDPDNIEETDKPIWSCTVKNDDTTYLNIGGIEGGKGIQYLTNIAETGMLDATKTYTLTFKYRIHKGTATATSQAVKFILQTQTAGTSLGSAERWYQENETEWRTATIENITPVANDLYTKLRLEGGSGTAGAVTGMTVDIDDCVFTEIVETFPASATVNKKMGSATVNMAEVAEGDTVTYTATEYYAGAFDGWYDGATKVSSEKVYTFTFDGTQALALTAKFKEDVIAQTFETGFVQNGSKIDRAPDSQESKPTYATVKNDNTTYLNIGGIEGGKGIQYLTNIAETGMLKTDGTKYNLTFKYRIHKGTATATSQAVKFTLQTQTAGTSLGSAERWYQENETEWRTATIENITPVANDLYTKLRLEGGSGTAGAVTGMTVDIDDCVFTEVVPAVSTSVTVEGTTGNATVDKAEVMVGDTVTYTATENLDGAFLGWYNGETLVSADKVYTFTYTGAEALALTAKFAAANATSATVNKKMGTATVDKAEIVKGNTVTYTATEYYAGAFDGWYDGATKVSSEKVYTFTFDGTQALALTAKFKEDVIAQTFETGFVQNGSKIDRAPDSQESKPTYATVKNDNTTYLNIGGIESGKNIQYLTNIAETGMLDATKTYTLTFKYRIHKGTATATSQAVKFILQTQTAGTSLGSAERWYNADYETEWRTATIENITPVADDLYTKLRLEGGSGTAGAVTGMTVDVDDCVFTEVVPTFATNVTVEGKLGTASVDKAEVKVGDTVTYTAKEFYADKFLGWFAGDEKVSDSLVYSFTYTGEQALDLTAKFKSDMIAQSFEIGWDSSDRRPAENLELKQYAPVALTEANGNKYIQVEASGKWLHYVINEAETGLLDTEKKYNVTFKYKILTATENAVHVFFWNESEAGSVTQDWNSIASNGGNNAKGVKLEYSAEAADTWQTATIYNVKTEDYTTGRLAAHVANATGVQFAIDDVIFTETFIANANAEGAGSAEVSKRYVEKGDTVTFTATANDNGEFVAWLDAEGNEVSTDATYTVTNFDGTQVINLTAKFKTLVSASATVDNPENGEATCVVDGDTVTFTATAFRENSFIGWFDAEGNFVNGNATFDVEVDGAAELSYTAKFKNADGSFDEDAFDKAFNAQFVEFNGTAIRAQSEGKPQALRFKTTIKARDMLAESGFVGMQVVEYGTLIGNTKKLAGAELTHATEGHLIGVAYNSAEDKDIVFENNNGDIQFTAALTGIKAKNYGDRLTMRAYIIVSDGENTYTVYADQYDYSVYDVMYAITISGNTDDIAIVDAILDADADVKAKFEEYVTVNFPAQA